MSAKFKLRQLIDNTVIYGLAIYRQPWPWPQELLEYFCLVRTYEGPWIFALTNLGH